jgi:acetyl esterase
MPTDYDALREQRMSEVDPELKAIYDLPGPGPEMGVEKFREIFEQMWPTMGGAGVQEGVTATDTEIDGPAGPMKVRIYRPDDAEGSQGAYFHTHGGGFMAGGGIDVWDGNNSTMALEWGCTVVHPDFRLPPEDQFPAGVEDCWAALQWLDQNAADLNIDRDRIAVGGGCTGANLASIMALMARDAGSPDLKAQFLWGPRLDLRTDYRSEFEFAEGYSLTREMDQWVTREYLGDMENRWDWRANPHMAESLRGLAPAVFSVGGWEILRDDARTYANRLRDAGVEVHYFEGDSQGHGHIYWKNVETGEYTKGAKQAQAEVAEVMSKKIGRESKPS